MAEPMVVFTNRLSKHVRDPRHYLRLPQIRLQTTPGHHRGSQLSTRRSGVWKVFWSEGQTAPLIGRRERDARRVQAVVEARPASPQMSGTRRFVPRRDRQRRKWRSNRPRIWLSLGRCKYVLTRAHFLCAGQRLWFPRLLRSGVATKCLLDGSLCRMS